jgi:hypothetical protein
VLVAGGAVATGFIQPTAAIGLTFFWGANRTFGECGKLYRLHQSNESINGFNASS